MFSVPLPVVTVPKGVCASVLTAPVPQLGLYLDEGL